MGHLADFSWEVMPGIDFADWELWRHKVGNQPFGCASLPPALLQFQPPTELSELPMPFAHSRQCSPVSLNLCLQDPKLAAKVPFTCLLKIFIQRLVGHLDAWQKLHVEQHWLFGQHAYHLVVHGAIPEDLFLQKTERLAAKIILCHLGNCNIPVLNHSAVLQPCVLVRPPHLLDDCAADLTGVTFKDCNGLLDHHVELCL